jgi:F-type H+-transporting ATPase subunit epsilon
MTMRLRVMLPSEALVDTRARKVTAHAVNGSFCLLPRHVDFVTVLVPGVLSFEDADGRESFVALDEAVLVKCGPDVRVSTPRAVAGAELGRLRDAVAHHFQRLDERERLSRTAVRKLEASFVRGLVHLEEAGGG